MKTIDFVKKNSSAVVGVTVFILVIVSALLIKIACFFFVISNPFSKFAENYHIQFRYENVRKINRREVIEN